MVSVLRFMPDEIPLKLRCPYSSYVGIRYVYLTSCFSQHSQTFLALIIAHEDNDMCVIVLVI